MHRTALFLVLTMMLPSIACRSATPRSLAPDQIPRETTVGILLLDGSYQTDFVAPMDVFQHAGRHTKPGTRVFTIGRALSPVATAEGLQILPDFTLDGAPPIDVLVIPSGENSKTTDREDPRIVAWLQQRAAKAQWIVSFCDGAFLLAQAGLIDGKRATTFPGDLDEFGKAYPAVRARRGASFVRDGRVITSVGGARAYDAALYLTEVLFGAPVARAVGSGVCIDWDLERADGEIHP